MQRRVALWAVLLIALCGCSPQNADSPVVAPAVAESPVVAPTPVVGDGPPTVDGVYIGKNVCPGEGCYLKGRIKAYEAADLFDKAGAQTASGKVAAGEWAEIIATEDRLIPVRGTVRAGRKMLVTGEVVYRLSSEGEGCFTLWVEGTLKSWCDPLVIGDPETEDLVIWEASPVATDMSGRLGLWVQVKRADDLDGWLHGVREFACTGYQDRDADCPAVP